MRVCIIGCGAVGSLFAAHLGRAGEAEVWAYDLWREHVDAINRDGLRLSGVADFTAREAAPLASGLPSQSGSSSTALLERVLYWTGGHPYMTQRLCLTLAQEAAEGEGSAAAISRDQA